MSSKAKFDYSTTADARCIGEYLQRIAEGLLAGAISLAADSESIELTPTGVVKLTIEADSNPDKSRGSLALDISWKATNQDSPPTLAISTGPRVEAVSVTRPSGDPPRSRRGGQPRE